MATKLKDLKLDDDHATAILEKAIEYESYTEDMPSSKRERIKAAGEQITLMIDAWIDDEVTPDNEDEDVAAMGVVIEEIFLLAGVEIDEDGEVSFGELGDLDGAEAEDGDEEEGDGDEAAFDIEDTIEGYEELSPASKVKAVKALELDADDDDDYNTLVGIYEWEEAQDKPSSRVLQYLDGVIPQEEGDAEEGEGDEPEEEDEGAEEAGAEGEWEEPWAKYDKQTAVEVKKALDKLMAKDELTAEMAQYVIDFENGRDKPPARKRIIDHATKLLAELEGGGEVEAEEEEPEEEAPRRSKRPARTTTARTTGSRRRSREPEPEEEPEPVSANGLFVISAAEFEDITAFGVFGAMGAVADLLAEGAEEVTVSAGRRLLRGGALAASGLPSRRTKAPRRKNCSRSSLVDWQLPSSTLGCTIGRWRWRGCQSLPTGTARCRSFPRTSPVRTTTHSATCLVTSPPA